MKTRSNFISTCLFALFLLPAVVQAQFTWITNNGAITITGYSGSNPFVTVPGTVTGLPVTTIGGSAFFGANMNSVTLPASVTTIGAESFGYCTGLSAISLSTNVMSVDSSAFYGCSTLVNISVAAGNPVYSSVGGVLFNINSLVAYPDGRTGSYSIPSGITFIEPGAFAGCAGLTAVSIPASVTGIGSEVFQYCTSLTSIMVDTANPNYSSAGGVLFDKLQVTLLAYPGGKPGAYTTMPNTVTNIGNSAFYLNSGLTSIVFPDSVKTISQNAFINCLSLTSVTFGTGITSIASYAFLDCSDLVSLYFKGNAPPPPGSGAFLSVAPAATVYYQAGTTGWGPTYGGLPTVELNSITGISAANHQFGFTFNGTNNQVIVIQACTNLTNPNWLALQTNTLTGPFNFKDPNWLNYPRRFYRVGSF